MSYFVFDVWKMKQFWMAWPNMIEGLFWLLFAYDDETPGIQSPSENRNGT